MIRQIVITGLGFVTSIGHSRSEVSQALRSLTHGIRPWQAVENTDLKVKNAGLLGGFELDSRNPAEWSWPSHFDIDRNSVRAMPPNCVYAMAALQQALREANLSDTELQDGATGLLNKAATRRGRSMSS